MADPVYSADELSERLFAAALGTFDIYTAYLGDRLGFYRALADGGPQSAVELSAAAGTNRRYTREWLEQQGATGILTCANPDAAPGERQYALPAEYHPLLLDDEDPAALGGLFQIMAGAVLPLPQVLEAFKSGAGVPFPDYGDDLAEGQARMNRPAFRHVLAQEWIQAMPDVAARFEADPPAKIADIGMGYGWSSIYLADAFPKITVDGFDLDDASVARANSLAAEHQLGDRVKFHLRDAGDPDLSGQYDFALAIECVHDMSDPVSVLGAMRRLVGPGGTVMIVDEKVPDAYSAPGDDADRFFYGFSVMHCLPVGMVEQPSAATGTVIREATMRDYAEKAGYTKVERLESDHPFLALYRMTG